MAREGLRTLVVAKKSLTEEQYQDFEVWKDRAILCFIIFDYFKENIPFFLFLRVRKIGNWGIVHNLLKALSFISGGSAVICRILFALLLDWTVFSQQLV